MYGFSRTSTRRLNSLRALDDHLRADIGLATPDMIPDTPSTPDMAPVAVRRSGLADSLRTSARAFAMPLAITGTCLG